VLVLGLNDALEAVEGQLGRGKLNASANCPAGEWDCGWGCQGPYMPNWDLEPGQDEGWNYCGPCGILCPYEIDHVTPHCIDGNCSFTCLAGYSDCDGIFDNGCETLGVCCAQHSSCGNCSSDSKCQWCEAGAAGRFCLDSFVGSCPGTFVTAVDCPRADGCSAIGADCKLCRKDADCAMCASGNGTGSCAIQGACPAGVACNQLAQCQKRPTCEACTNRGSGCAWCATVDGELGCTDTASCDPQGFVTDCKATEWRRNGICAAFSSPAECSLCRVNGCHWCDIGAGAQGCYTQCTPDYTRSAQSHESTNCQGFNSNMMAAQSHVTIHMAGANRQTGSIGGAAVALAVAIGKMY